MLATATALMHHAWGAIVQMMQDEAGTVSRRHAIVFAARSLQSWVGLETSHAVAPRHFVLRPRNTLFMPIIDPTYAAFLG
jgi:hypothetical protein